MMNQVLAEFNRMVHSLEESREFLTADQPHYTVILSESYVVRCGDVCLRYKISGRKAVDPLPCLANLATRFSKRDAEAAAANTYNGKSEMAVAVPLLVAIDEELTKLRNLIQIAEKYAKKVPS